MNAALWSCLWLIACHPDLSVEDPKSEIPEPEDTDPTVVESVEDSDTDPGLVPDDTAVTPPPLTRHAVNKISLYINFACAVHEVRGLWCWGSTTELEPEPDEDAIFGDHFSGAPTGMLLADLDASDYATGVALDGSLVAWDHGDTLPEPLVQYQGGNCWLYESGVMECNDGQRREGVRFLDSQDGRSAAVCTIDFDDALTCWGMVWDRDVFFDVDPSLRWRIAHFSLNGLCGILTSGDLHCDSNYGEVSESVPLGYDWIDVRPTDGAACALDGAGEIHCWGQPHVMSWIGDVPTGPFIAMDLYGLDACAMRPEGEVVCWGKNDFGELSPTPPPPWP